MKPEQLELIREASPAELLAFGGAAPSFESIAPYDGAAEYVRGSQSQLASQLERETADLVNLRTRYAEFIREGDDALTDYDRSMSDDLEGSVSIALTLIRNQIAFAKGTINAVQKILKEKPCAKNRSA